MEITLFGVIFLICMCRDLGVLPTVMNIMKIYIYREKDPTYLVLVLTTEELLRHGGDRMMLWDFSFYSGDGEAGQRGETDEGNRYSS